MNADGSGQRNLTRNPANDHLLAIAPWSPDGRKIVFERDHDGGDSDHIYVINADGSGERKLTQHGRATSLVARRAEDRLPKQTQRQLGYLRHERRRQRPAEPDTQPGEGRGRARLVARAEIGRDSSTCSEAASLGERTVAREPVGDKDTSVVAGSTPGSTSSECPMTPQVTESLAGRAGLTGASSLRRSCAASYSCPCGSRADRGMRIAPLSESRTAGSWPRSTAR